MTNQIHSYSPVLNKADFSDSSLKEVKQLDQNQIPTRFFSRETIFLPKIEKSLELNQSTTLDQTSSSFSNNDFFQNLQNSLLRELQKNQQSSQKEEEKDEKIIQLLMAALRSGHVDLAMTLFSSVENHQAQQLTRLLTEQMLQLQQNRKKMTLELAKIGNSEAGKKKAMELQNSIQELHETAQTLTAFIRDVQDQKNRTAEFANNLTTSEHSTTMSLIRGMK